MSWLASCTNLLSPATGQISVVPWVQLIRITAWLHLTYLGKLLFNSFKLLRIDYWLNFFILLRGDIFIHGRNFVKFDHLESISGHGTSGFTFTWRILKVVSVGVSRELGSRSSGRWDDILELWADATFIKPFLECHIGGSVLKTSHCHLRFGYLNVTLWSNLLAFLTQSASLLRHNWFSSLHFS